MSSRGNRHSFGGTNSLSYAAGKFKSKENEFTEAIDKYSTQAMQIAESLKISGEYEKAILGAKVEDEEATLNYLMEQRNRLKALCVKSALSSRYAKSFGLTMSDVYTEIQNQSYRTQNPTESSNFDESTTNYEQWISNKMREHETNQEGNSSTVDDARIVQVCQKILGEKSSKKKTRQSSEDDEDELEVIDSSSKANVKCPITQQVMKKPMRNKICSHVYEEAAIKEHIRRGNATGKTVCPIAGCSNKVTTEQLEDDPITLMHVKRHLKKEEAAKKQRIEQSFKDEGDNEIRDGGTTIIE